MSTCTYDNPATMSRECWQDGRLICAYSFKILPPFAKYPIPGYLFFFGANVGPWEEERLIGDAEAMGSYKIVVPGVGEVDAPDPRNLGEADDRTVLAALYTAEGNVDPVALQILVDRKLCYRGDFKADIERRIAQKEDKT